MPRMKQLPNSFGYSFVDIGGTVVTHGLMEFPMESTFTHPTLKGLRDHAYMFPPTEVLYPSFPIRFHHSGCPILEQTAG